MHIEYSKACTGCEACVNTCPKHCISMAENSEGFYYPQVQLEMCVDCGLCVKRCPVINKTSIKCPETPVAYAAINRDEEIRKNSSSGGLFSALASYVLINEGVVFGAAFSPDFQYVEHIDVETPDALRVLRGSKYLQSKIGEAYQKAKSYLEAGRQVLFSGTPCQIDGLYSYLDRDYDNLITQDLICHGVPSPRIWKEYVKLLESQFRSQITSVSFRDKTTGWSKFSFSVDFTNNKTYSKKLTEDPYMEGFLSNLYLRDSCYQCKCKEIVRQSDITLADFWGVNQIMPDIYDDKGISVVIIHSAKGAKLLDHVASKNHIVRIDINDAIAYNSAAIESVPHNKKRASFFNLFRKRGIAYALKKYCRKNLLSKVKQKIRGIYKRSLNCFNKIFCAG